jgi:hypothetical protein
MISFIQFKYAEFTDEFIQRILVRLYSDDLINPDYLFVNEKGRNDIRPVLENAPDRLFFAGRAVDDIASRYTNRTTGKAMHIVVLPTLPDNLLCLGNLSLPEWDQGGIWGEDTFNTQPQ